MNRASRSLAVSASAARAAPADAALEASTEIETGTQLRTTELEGHPFGPSGKQLTGQDRQILTRVAPTDAAWVAWPEHNRRGLLLARPEIA